MFRSLFRKIKNFIKWTLVTIGASFVLLLAYFTVSYINDVHKDKLQRISQEQVVKACFSADPDLSAHGLCVYTAEKYFPDMLGRCEGYNMFTLEVFKYQCEQLRKKNPEKVTWSGVHKK